MTEDVNTIDVEQALAEVNATIQSHNQKNLPIHSGILDTHQLLTRLKAAEDALKQFRDVTFGQQAYEAYCKKTDWKSLVTGADLPQWASLPHTIQEAWCAAAWAVGRTMIGRMIKVRSEGSY